MPTVDDTSVARKLWDDLKSASVGVADLRGRPDDMRKLTPGEELLLFNKVADGWTVEQEEALLASGKTRAEVGAAKFPHRLKLAASGDRALSKYAQAKWMGDMARKSDPTWAPRPNVPPALPGAPDPLVGG